MQKGILLLLLLAGAFTGQSQSLKDLLYSGKLKLDSNSVVRKTDDLSTKIDTAQKKPAPAVKDSVTAVADGAKKGNLPAVAGLPAEATLATTAEGTTTITGADGAKSNTKLWKEYTDELVKTLQPDVDAAKKIKKETYHVLVAYAIDVTGQVTVSKLSVTPANDMLQAQISQYMDVTPPLLHPTLDGAKNPKKVNKSGSFSITKN